MSIYLVAYVVVAVVLVFVGAVAGHIRYTDILENGDGWSQSRHGRKMLAESASDDELMFWGGIGILWPCVVLIAPLVLCAIGIFWGLGSAAGLVGDAIRAGRGK